eukprot:TRINITY_DN463_c0_g2_i1.p1 TRINITY_DN463_c0_g2~~TRINITY_DN463_c0_g2_i1.p1  ORF type:complete len:605 (-),score=137.22 TRINITY_DN463_c0_g2_i1:86-1708(-)
MGGCTSRHGSTAKTLVVSASGGGHFTTLSEAVGASAPGTTIVVRPGNYSEMGEVLLEKPLHIIGDDGVNVTACFVINVRCESRQERVILENLTVTCQKNTSAVLVTGGYVYMDSCTITGGRDCFTVQGSNSFPVLTDCCIHSAERAGAVFTEHSQGELRNCKIYNNSTGVIIETESEPCFFQCNVSRCGTGLHARDSARGYFSSCTFEHNSKPGVLVTSKANPVFSHCSIGAGESNGVFVRDEGLGVFVECDIWGNALPGVATCTGGDPIVSGCTVREGRNAGVLVYDSGRGVVSGCSVRLNQMPGVEVRAGGNPVINNCSIFKGDSNGIYVHNKGCGVFTACNVYENVLPGVAVRTNGAPVLVGSKLTTGKDNALLVCDRGRGTFIACELNGYSTRPMEVRDGCTPTFHECSMHDGKNVTVMQWLEQIPLSPTALDPDPALSAQGDAPDTEPVAPPMAETQATPAVPPAAPASPVPQKQQPQQQPQPPASQQQPQPPASQQQPQPPQPQSPLQRTTKRGSEDGAPQGDASSRASTRDEA